MFKISRKYLFVVALMLLVTLTACHTTTTTTTTTTAAITTTINPDIALVADAKSSLILGDLSNVSGDITLPTEGRNGTTISWSSNNTDVITNDGHVTQPAVGEDNAHVTLTATITLKMLTDTKTFDVKVMALQNEIVTGTIVMY